MVITSINQQVKNPDRVSIFVDGKYCFSLSLDQLVSERLVKGKELDETQLKTLKKLSEEGKIRARTLNWLLLRPHSTKELKDYLFRKKVEPDFGTMLVEEFTAKGYLNDLQFSEWFFEIKKSGGRSNRYISSELLKKGVNMQLIKEVTTELDNDELERLKEVVAKKRTQNRYKDDTKLTQYLLRQGFNYSDIKEILKST